MRRIRTFIRSFIESSKDSLRLPARSESKTLQSILGRAVDNGFEDFKLQSEAVDFVRNSLRADSKAQGPAIAETIRQLYPFDFEIPRCAACGTERWLPQYTGIKTIPARIYDGAPELPIFAREMLPLIYATCQSCGMGRIVPSPKDFWIDVHIPAAGQFAQWMDNPAYLQEKREHALAHYRRAELEGFKAHNKVFEVSPGNGIFLKILRDELGWQKVAGVEPDLSAVRSARECFGLELIPGHIYTVRDRTDYDLCIFDNSLEHHSKPQMALRVAKDILRPGGGVFVIVPNYHSYAVEELEIEYFNMNWGHWQYFTMQSLHRILTAAGFEVISGYSTFLEPSLARKFPEKYAQSSPDIEITMSGKRIAGLRAEERAFRGEFLCVTARKPA